MFKMRISCPRLTSSCPRGAFWRSSCPRIQKEELLPPYAYPPSIHTAKSILRDAQVTRESERVFMVESTPYDYSSETHCIYWGGKRINICCLSILVNLKRTSILNKHPECKKADPNPAKSDLTSTLYNILFELNSGTFCLNRQTDKDSPKKNYCYFE